ncbi:MAG TPA: formyltransferase family protein [Burkholderiaceae bacterium]|nr:formyltransferase family protein [Burkholderiaceae bacterium]
MSLRIVFIGCVESSKVALQALLASPPELAQVVGVMTRRASAFNADFVDLSPLAHDAGLAWLQAEDATGDDEQAAWVEQLGADVVFCVGWSRLLGPRLLAAPARGVVGFHPAALPANRGRHPLVWALALGLQETASSFFLMRADADSGPLLSQKTIAIARTDDAGALYEKVLDAIRSQIPRIVEEMARGTLQAREQDHARANHWRRRSAIDGQIDWRMGAGSIYNLVRALARPYPGAHFVHQQHAVKVWRSEVSNDGASNIEPGKVLAVEGSRLLIKCGTESLWLLEHELQSLPCPGDYL